MCVCACVCACSGSTWEGCGVHRVRPSNALSLLAKHKLQGLKKVSQHKLLSSSASSKHTNTLLSSWNEGFKSTGEKAVGDQTRAADAFFYCCDVLSQYLSVTAEVCGLTSTLLPAFVDNDLQMDDQTERLSLDSAYCCWSSTDYNSSLSVDLGRSGPSWSKSPSVYSADILLNEKICSKLSSWKSCAVRLNIPL